MGALFTADPNLVRVGVIGTYPTGDQELPAVTVWAKRTATEDWSALSGTQLDRVAESMDIKPRYQP